MADVVMPPAPPSIGCKFDEAWKGKCDRPSDNGWCSKHEDLKCISCGAKAVCDCDHAGSLVCGAPLCGECTHEPRGDGHIKNSAAKEFYKQEHKLREAKIASRTSPDQLMNEALGVPLNLFELLKGDLAGYELKECYYLELRHTLMGFFPALIECDRMVITTDKELLAKVWRLLSPRESVMGSVLGYVNVELGIMYPIKGDTLEEREQSEPIRLLTEREFRVLTAGEAKSSLIFQWAPGLIGRGRLSEDSFSLMISRALDPAAH